MATAERAVTVRGAGALRPVLRRALSVGLVGGISGVYIAMTGVLGKFDERPLIFEVVSLGYSMLLVILLVTGFQAGRRKGVTGLEISQPAGSRLLGGLAGGAVAGVVLALFVLLFSAIEATFFVSVNARLLDDILTLGQGAGLGAVVLIGLGAGVGLLGAAFHLLRPRDRRAVNAGLIAVLIIGTLEELLNVTLNNLDVETSWLYEGNGLSVTGAIIVFIVATGISLLLGHREQVFSRFAARGRRPITDEERITTAVQVREAAAPADRGDKAALGLGIAALAFSGLLAVLSFIQDEVDNSLLLAAAVFGGVALVFAVVRARSAQLGGRRRTMPTFGFVTAAASLFAVMPLLVGSFLSDVLGNVGIYVLLGLGLNIVVGFAGLLDLGYVAFFAVGAYGVGLLTSPISGLVAEGVGEFGSGSQIPGEPVTTFWIALPIVVIASVLVGILLGAPVVRLRGDYLAIVTLGFGEIIRVIVQSDWAAPLLGGSQGLKRIPAPPPAFLDLRDPQRIYFLILLACLLMAYVSWRLQYSRVGRAWAAMREDEDVAEAMGISIIKYKLLAFAIGAGVGSLGGIFFAAKIGVTTPESFQLLVSIAVLSLIILGGMGSIPGVIVGSAVLIGLPEILREFGEYRLLFYGAALVAIMILKPEGLLPNVRRRRELQERATDVESAVDAAPTGELS